MKGWSRVEIRKDVEGRDYRLSSPNGVSVSELISVLGEWLTELSKVKAEADEKAKEEAESTDVEGEKEGVEAEKSDSSDSA